jgi:hypothetical protein
MAVCITCHTEFDAARSDARYCSSACRQKSYRNRPKLATPGTDVDALAADLLLRHDEIIAAAVSADTKSVVSAKAVKALEPTDDAPLTRMRIQNGELTTVREARAAALDEIAESRQQYRDNPTNVAALKERLDTLADAYGTGFVIQVFEDWKRWRLK